MLSLADLFDFGFDAIVSTAVFFSFLFFFTQNWCIDYAQCLCNGPFFRHLLLSHNQLSGLQVGLFSGTENAPFPWEPHYWSQKKILSTINCLNKHQTGYTRVTRRICQSHVPISLITRHIKQKLAYFTFFANLNVNIGTWNSDLSSFMTDDMTSRITFHTHPRKSTINGHHSKNAFIFLRLSPKLPSYAVYIFYTQLKT